MKSELNIAYCKKQGCLLDWHKAEKGCGVTIVHLHGGGLHEGGRADDAERWMARVYTEAGYDFVSVEYSMYPAAKYPEFVEDAAAAIAYVKNHTGDKIVVQGRSAGAWIAGMLYADKKYLKNAGVAPSDIKGWLLESGQMTSHFYILEHEKNTPSYAQRIDDVAPLYYIDGTQGVSPVLLVTYTEDMLCRKENNLLFRAAVNSLNEGANVEWKELEGTHCSGLRPTESGYEYTDVTLEFLARRVK